jgi:transcriptional regulator with XRE-family HTH domain
MGNYSEHVEAMLAAPKPITRKTRSPIGEILDGLMRAKGWTARDLAEAVKNDGQLKAIPHQYIYTIMRGTRNPSKRVLDRLLKPFGYRAVEEIRLEPIPNQDAEDNKVTRS